MAVDRCQLKRARQPAASSSLPQSYEISADSPSTELHSIACTCADCVIPNDMQARTCILTYVRKAAKYPATMGSACASLSLLKSGRVSSPRAGILYLCSSAGAQLTRPLCSLFPAMCCLVINKGSSSVFSSIALSLLFLARFLTWNHSVVLGTFK